jgi:hypothetical protein
MTNPTENGKYREFTPQEVHDAVESGREEPWCGSRLVYKADYTALEAKVLELESMCEKLAAGLRRSCGYGPPFNIEGCQCVACEAIASYQKLKEDEKC